MLSSVDRYTSFILCSWCDIFKGNYERQGWSRISNFRTSSDKKFDHKYKDYVLLTKVTGISTAITKRNNECSLISDMELGDSSVVHIACLPNSTKEKKKNHTCWCDQCWRMFSKQDIVHELPHHVSKDRLYLNWTLCISTRAQSACVTWLSTSCLQGFLGS